MNIVLSLAEDGSLMKLLILGLDQLLHLHIEGWPLAPLTTGGPLDDPVDALIIVSSVLLACGHV